MYTRLGPARLKAVRMQYEPGTSAFQTAANRAPSVRHALGEGSWGKGGGGLGDRRRGRSRLGVVKQLLGLGWLGPLQVGLLQQLVVCGSADDQPLRAIGVAVELVGRHVVSGTAATHATHNTIHTEHSGAQARHPSALQPHPPFGTVCKHGARLCSLLWAEGFGSGRTHGGVTGHTQRRGVLRAALPAVAVAAPCARREPRHSPLGLRERAAAMSGRRGGSTHRKWAGWEGGNLAGTGTARQSPEQPRRLGVGRRVLSGGGLEWHTGEERPRSADNTSKVRPFAVAPRNFNGAGLWRSRCVVARSLWPAILGLHLA